MRYPRLSDLTHDSIAFWFNPGNDGPPAEAAMRIAEAVDMPVSTGADDYDTAERRIDAWLRDLSPSAQERNVSAVRMRLDREVEPDLVHALRAMGVSPSAFMVLASDGITVSADVRLSEDQDPLASVQAAIGAQGRRDAITIPLSVDLYATAGELLVRQGALPEAAVLRMAGRPATDVADHPLLRGRLVSATQDLPAMSSGFDRIRLDPLPTSTWRKALGLPPAGTIRD